MTPIAISTAHEITVPHQRLRNSFRAMARESAFPPRFCPICGLDSILPIVRKDVLNLYRCGAGHFFVFDPVPKLTDRKPEH